MVNPEIVIVDDEVPQLITMRSALRDLGRIHEYSRSTDALRYMRDHPADVAIIDVHIPGEKMNGLDLIKEVRAFDQDLCILVRTGDTSTEIADNAIESRVFRRVVKGKSDVAEFRALVLAAIRETGVRRKATIDAAATAETKSHLVRALGTAEEEHATVDSYRKFFLALRNRTTALAGSAELIKAAVEAKQAGTLKANAELNHALVRELVAEINSFMDGPYAHTLRSAQGSRRSTVNRVIEVLKLRFEGNSKWLSGDRRLTASGLIDDLFVSVAPTALLTALRHLAEYCLSRSAPQSTTTISAALVTSPLKTELGAVVLTTSEELVYPAIWVRVTSQFLDFSADDIKRGLNGDVPDPREANLEMIALAVGASRASLAIEQTGNAVTFRLALPLAQ